MSNVKTKTLRDSKILRMLRKETDQDSSKGVETKTDGLATHLTPSRHPQTHSRQPPDMLKTPSRHPLDTQTPNNFQPPKLH